MNLKPYISIIFFSTIFWVFSYGQSSELRTVCAESTESYGVDGFASSEFLWSVEGGAIVNGDGTEQIDVQWGYETGRYRMEVVEYTIAGCMSSPSIAYVVVQAPEVDLGYRYYEICEHDSVVFDATGQYYGNYSFVWHNGSSNATYTAKTTENIWIEVTDGLGCKRTDSVEFVVHSLPVIDIGYDTILCDLQNPLELNAGINYSYHEWFRSSSDNEVVSTEYYYDVYPGADTISVIVTDFNNCVNSDTLVVLACDINELFREIPNTFTPNGDDINDSWEIPHMDQFPKAVLEVFDRWGRLVFHTDNVESNMWDGTSKGKDMPMDTYFYVLEFNLHGFEPLSGTINLIR